jgi:hypothetical protein
VEILKLLTISNFQSCRSLFAPSLLSLLVI